MIVAAIPVKALADAKSRLAPHLTSAARQDLVLCLLRNTIAAIKASEAVERIALVTPEPHLAEALGVDLVPDAGGLNESLGRAVQWALSLGSSRLLIVPGDLPRITSDAVHDLITTDPPLYGVAIVPTTDGGTGALLLTPPNIIPPAFGPDSFVRHLTLAHLQGVRAEQVEAAAFSFDLDTPEDLARLRDSGP